LGTASSTIIETLGRAPQSKGSDRLAIRAPAIPAAH
jgi:hypothetical protein